MDEIHSQGYKALLTLVFVVLINSLALAFSDAFPVNSDSTAYIAPIPAAAMQVAEMELRQSIVGYAKNYLGRKYRYGGRTPETNFDCSGFTHHVMGVFGIHLSPSSVQQSLQGDPVKLKEVQTGDLIFFRRSARSRISHVAMVVSNDEDKIFIIHSTLRGIVIDDLMKSSYWRPKIHSARRVINAEHKETLMAMLAVAGCDALDNAQEQEEEEDEKAIAEQLYCLDEHLLRTEPLPTLPLRELKF